MKKCMLLCVLTASILLFKGCSERISWAMHTEWIFINETSHEIEIICYMHNFNIKSGETYTYKHTGDAGSKNDPIEKCYPFCRAGEKIIIDGNEHIFAERETLTDIKNYDGEKIGNNNFKFTYRFTDSNTNYED